MYKDWRVLLWSKAQICTFVLSFSTLRLNIGSEGESAENRDRSLMRVLSNGSPGARGFIVSHSLQFLSSHLDLPGRTTHGLIFTFHLAHPTTILRASTFSYTESPGRSAASSIHIYIWEKHSLLSDHSSHSLSS